MSSVPTTVVLADDHRLVREGVRMLLQRESDLAVIGVSDDGPQTVDLVSRLRPDVLVLDLVMPSMSGLDVLKHVTADIPETRVVILSVHADEWHVRQTLAAGAAGYVVKDAEAGELLHAIREAVGGRQYVSVPSAAHARETRAPGAGRPVEATLTPRELEVFQLAAMGRTAQQIAAALGMSPRTAETHRRNLMRKLSLRSQTDLVRYAIRIGAVPPGL